MPKMVHLEETPIGSARTWHEVAQLLSAALKRSITAREAQDNGSEGRDGFYITMRR
jgi:hypothetical protein